MADKEFKVKHGIAMGDGVIKFDAETGAWQLSADGSTFYSVASASTSLDGLADVSASSPSSGDFLKWNGSAWVNDVIDLGTDTSGNYIVDVTGGTGVSVSHTPGEGSNPTISIGQDVGTSASVTFGNVNTSGDVTVGGNLTVNGTTTTVNTETINLADNTITLNSNETGAPTQNAGIEVERGTSANVQLRWNETTDKWEVTNDGSEYNEIVDLHLLNTKIAEEHYHRSVWLLSTIPLSGSPTYTPGSLDEDGGYGIGATLSSSVNETLEVDGETPYVGARIGVFGQSNAIHNGIYVVTSVGSVSTAWTLTRADDANGSFPEQLKRGETIPVAWGNANIIQAFGISSDGSAPNGGHIFGTDEITVIQVSGTAQLVKGNGIEFTGNIISAQVVTDGALINTVDGLNLPNISASVVSGNEAVDFLRSVSLDGFGRVIGYELATLRDINLGTETAGNYVQNVFSGTGINVSGSGAESASVTISTVQDISTSSSVQFSLLNLDNLEVSASITSNDLNVVNGEITNLNTSQIYTQDINAINVGTTNLTATDIYSSSVAVSDATIVALSSTSASAQDFYGELTGNVFGSLTGNVFGDVSGNVTGNLLGNVTGNLSGSASFAEEAEQLSNARLIALSGDVIGSALFDGTENITISTTVANNSVQLGTDTTGNYVSDVSAGTGVTVTHSPGEGSTATVAIGQNVSTSSSVTFAHVSANLTGDVTGNISGNSGTASALENPVSISLSGDVTGSVSFDGSSSATITTAIQPNSVALGADTSGDYVQNLTAGTGVTLSNNSGEGSSPTVSIGQDVATSASPTFYNLETTHNLIVGGNLVVSGSVQTLNQSVLQIDDSFVYLNHNDEQGLFDLGIGGNYNDGSYKHTGIFRDATDGKWKFFDEYQPDIAHPVDTDHPSFSFAPVVAETFESTIAIGTAPFSVSSSTVVTNLNADKLDGQDGSYYAPLASPTFTGTVTLPSGTVTSEMIADGSITNTDINSSAAIAISKLANGSSGQIIVANSSGVPTWVSNTGDVTISNTGVTSISSGVIVDADISSSAAISLEKIADVSTNAQTSSYTLVLSDKNKVVEMNVGSANNLTVPSNSSVAFPVGAQINILQTGAGQTTIVAGSGVTINATPGLKMRAQWSYATLIKRDTDTWVLVGDISA